jgi:Ca2+:H+ antiporter
VLGGLHRQERIELGLGAVLVACAALAHYLGLTPVLAFLVAAAAIAVLARMVGHATEQVGSRLGSGATGTLQSALGNLPELFICLFALHDGLVGVVKAALVGSVLANSVLVLGVAFVVGGLKHGTQRFDSPRARMTATLAVLAAATMAVPSFAHGLHSPAAAHEKTLSLICAGVLLSIFILTLPGLLSRVEGEPDAKEESRWAPQTAIAVLAGAAVAAAFTSEWFVTALTPAIDSLGMSQEFAGLVVVAIAGNAVENVIGIQLAAKDQMDFAISVIVTSSLQIALALTPVLVFASLLFATQLTLVFPVLLAIALLLAAGLAALVVYDGESTWPEGAILIGLYIVIVSSFWWGS